MRDIRQWVHDRREVLAREREVGEARLRELEREVAVLQRSLVEVGGAVRVLDELIAENGADDAQPASSAHDDDLSVGDR